MAKEPMKRKLKPAVKKKRAVKATPKKRTKKKIAKKKTAKKKKKKGRKTHRQSQIKTHGQSDLSSVELPRGNNLVRWQAAQSYIYDVDQRSIEWWSKNHFTQIPYETFKDWAISDRWYPRREAHWDAVQGAVARQYAGKHTAAMMSELEEIDDMVTTAGSLVMGKNQKGELVPLAPVKSYEGSVGAFVKISQHRDDKRKATLDNLPLALGVGGAVDAMEDLGPEVGWTQDQLRAMSTAALRVEFQLEAPKEPEGEEEG